MELSFRDWLLIGESWLSLLLVKLALFLRSKATIQAALEQTGDRGVNIDTRLLRAFTIAVSHHIYAPNCLPQSLALCRLLRKRSIGAVMHIGTRKVGDNLEAHAWVEVGGQVVNDAHDTAGQFAAFVRS